MIRVVFDTNVLASGALVRGAAVARVLDRALAGDFQLVLSPNILTELERTLQKPYFARHLTAELVGRFVAGLRAVALVTIISSPVAGVASHPEDDAILATAIDGQAEYLVTGDKALQALH